MTDGAYEALFTAILGHVNPGDEVVIIEPYFDCYEPMVRLAGGTPVFISLKPVSLLWNQISTRTHIIAIVRQRRTELSPLPTGNWTWRS